MRFVFDIDETITIKAGQDYTIDSLPNTKIINLINRLYEAGHTIVFFTARKMQSSNHNVGLAIANGGYNTFKWLEKHNVKYHEIFFGKPNGDIYLDDKAFGYDEKKIIAYLEDILKESK